MQASGACHPLQARNFFLDDNVQSHNLGQGVTPSDGEYSVGWTAAGSRLNLPEYRVR